MKGGIWGCLTVILAIVRFLLLQALTSCGHDESHTSSNKGNFLELTDWLKMRDEGVKKLFDSAPRNTLLHQMYKKICVRLVLSRQLKPSWMTLEIKSSLFLWTSLVMHLSSNTNPVIDHCQRILFHTHRFAANPLHLGSVCDR